MAMFNFLHCALTYNSRVSVLFNLLYFEGAMNDIWFLFSQSEDLIYAAKMELLFISVE